MYEIEKNIPIPKDADGRGWVKYPFRDMIVGDSFKVPGKHAKDRKVALTSTMVNYWNKRSGKYFIIRKVDKSSYRVWRVQ